jgi:hypothetical protein
MGKQLALWVETRTFTAAEIAAMPMEEYAKYRSFLLAEAKLAMATKQVTMQDILKMSNS